MRRGSARALVAVALGLSLAGVTIATRRCGRRPLTGQGADGGARRAAEGPRYAHASIATMGTRVEVLVPVSHERAAQAVLEVFREVNEQMSSYSATSSLSQVNRSAGHRAVAVPKDLLAVVTRALEISKLSGGAFDISWAALRGLWDFRAATPRVPTPAEIAARTALVGYRGIIVDHVAGTIALRRRGMRIDLGGIAKGFALDRAAVRLRERGVRSFLISGGGQVLAGGRRGDRPWRVGVRDPRGPIDDYCASLDLVDASISTSGDYERFFVRDGVRYHHILDPRTGSPTRSRLRSATVIAPDAITADALSTALMVLGRKEGLALLARFPGAEALLIDDEARPHATPGLQGKLRWNHPPLKGPDPATDLPRGKE